MPHGFGFRGGQFRVASRILGEAVMGEMEVAKPVGGQRDRQAAEPRDGIVEPLRLESRPVHGLVQQREQEHDQDALRQHQDRPDRRLGRDQRAKDDDGAEVDGELDEARHIRLAGHPPAFLIAQRGDEVAMVHGFIATEGVHEARLPGEKPFEKRGILQNR